MTRVFASRVRSSANSWTKPAIFLLQVDSHLLGFLARCWANVQEASKQLPQEFESSTFFCHGIWSEDAALSDQLLGDRDYDWLSTMPDADEMNHVEGHRVRLFASGNLSFEAYDVWDGEEFESVLVNLEEFKSNFSFAV